ASTAATRWIVAAAPSPPSSSFVIPGRGRSLRTRNPETDSERAPGYRVRPFGPSRNDGDEMADETGGYFTARLTRNRRGPLGAWTLQWSDDDERFVLAAPAQPVAAPAADRPHRKIACGWLVIPGRGRSPRTRNPETDSERAPGFRVRPFGPSRNDGGLRQARQCRGADRGRRRGRTAGLVARACAGAGARHASCNRCHRGRRRGRCSAARADRRLVPALYAAGRLRSARRLAARHFRLRASLRRRGRPGGRPQR